MRIGQPLGALSGKPEPRRHDSEAPYNIRPAEWGRTIGERRVEVGLVGKEGFVGWPLFAGFRTAPTRAIAQIDATAFRLDAETLMAADEKTRIWLIDFYRIPALTSFLRKKAVAIRRLQNGIVQPRHSEFCHRITFLEPLPDLEENQTLNFPPLDISQQQLAAEDLGIGS
jgi:hypothetical protein